MAMVHYESVIDKQSLRWWTLVVILELCFVVDITLWCCWTMGVVLDHSGVGDRPYGCRS